MDSAAMQRECAISVSSNEEDSDDKLPYGKKKDEEAVKYKKRVFEFLKQTKTDSAEFAISKQLDQPPVLVIEIKDVGKISFPVFEDQAKKIIAKSKQSPFGKKTETVIDTTVRNSWQLEPHSFKISNSDWVTYLNKEILEVIVQEFYIKTPFTAALYKLLLYEPGSFFKPHRDTEKEDGMFGTLVVQLPSEYSGGELVINHDSRTKRFDFSSKGQNEAKQFKMFFAAFYCDCQHEILPVTEGYRVCLVYNLVSTQVDNIPALLQFDQLESIFLKIIEDWKEGKPFKIVYALSHKYTERGLSNLKGADNAVASFIKSCAEKCRLRVFLALLTKHITGGACGPEYDYTIDDDTIETHYNLSNLICLDGKKTKLDELKVRFYNELIPSGFFKSREPDKEEYQEYTGNEGATVDKWYKGAAIVFWPEDHTATVFSDANASHEVIAEYYLDIYNQHVSNPGENKGLDHVLKWLSVVLQQKYWSISNDLSRKVVDSVFALGSLPLLKQLLEKYNILKLSPLPALLEQCQKYGWSSLEQDIISMFEKLPNKEEKVDQLLLLMPEECVCDLNKKETLVKCLKDIPSERVTVSSFRSWHFPPREPPSVSSEKTFFCKVFHAARKLDFDMSEYAKKFPLVISEALLELSTVSGFPAHPVWVNSALLCLELLKALTEEKLTLPSFRRNDTLTCTCTDCQKLKAFLSSDREQEQFKIGKQRRLHLHQKMNVMPDLTHETMRFGNPQTLVVTKTRGEFQKKIANRAQAEVLLSKLKLALNISLGAETKCEVPSKIVKTEPFQDKTNYEVPAKIIKTEL